MIKESRSLDGANPKSILKTRRASFSFDLVFSLLEKEKLSRETKDCKGNSIVKISYNMSLFFRKTYYHSTFFGSLNVLFLNG